MIRKIIICSAIALCFVCSAFAEIPIYPGARLIDAKASPNLNAVNIQSSSNMSSNTKTSNYALPSNVNFEDVRKFYVTELNKHGYMEKTGLSTGIAAANARMVSFSSKDNMHSVSISLVPNPTNSKESILSLSETSTRMN